MMPKAKRFILFGVGVFIGCIMVYFILIKDRNRTDWLPGNRVKTAIMSSEIYFSKHAECMMDCRGIDEESVMDILENGDVNFSASNIHETACPSYAIEGITSNDKNIRIIVTTIDSVSEIETAIDLDAQKDSCACLPIN